MFEQTKALCQQFLDMGIDGVRVVELATHVVIPAAARVMADWGADVIKVEASGGDQWRVLGRSVEPGHFVACHLVGN